jgi:Ni,Fe-hydrogenase I cytochrome b subunit
MAEGSITPLSERLFALLRILQIAMLVMTLFYVGLGEIVRGNRSQELTTLFLALLIAAAVESVGVIFVRSSLIPKVQQALQADSEDRQALLAFRKWYVICFALCLSVAFYGLVLRIMGAPFQRAIVFYAAGFCLILVCTPRK